MALAERDSLQNQQERAIERHRANQMRRKRKLLQLKVSVEPRQIGARSANHGSMCPCPCAGSQEEEIPEEQAEKEALEKLKEAKVLIPSAFLPSSAPRADLI